MDKPTLISVSLATSLLIIGTLLGFANFHINLKIMHTLIGISFILIVIFGLQNHYSRLINISPTNKIAWMHFIVFSFLLFLSVRAIKKWNSNSHKKHKH